MDYLIVGRKELSSVVLLTKDHHVIEFPANRLPFAGLKEGSLLQYDVSLDSAEDARRIKDFLDFQRELTNDAHDAYVAANTVDYMGGNREVSELLPSALYLCGRKGIIDRDILNRVGADIIVYVASVPIDNIPQTMGRPRSILHISNARVDWGNIFKEVWTFVDSHQGSCVVLGGDDSAFGLAIAFLMSSRRMPLRDACSFVKVRRSSILLDFGMASHLQTSEQELFHHSDTSFLADHVLATLVGWNVSKEDLMAALLKNNNDVNLTIDSFCEN